VSPFRAILLLPIAVLAGCGSAERLAAIGRPPKLAPPEAVAAPAFPTALGAMGAIGRSAGEVETAVSAGSLYRDGYQAFFRDQRAYRIGDILTVKVNITDKAQVENSTSRNRAGGESLGLPNFLGLESLLRTFLPKAVDPSKLVSASSDSKLNGTGQTKRAETIDMTIAAVVMNVLPNGNFVIRGRQQVRVNFELRELVITGIVRPQDISRDNAIAHSQIADAQISYGGKGNLTEVQQARWGQQVYDALAPF
jgi:flagellar L-ring protein FlgH